MTTMSYILLGQIENITLGQFSDWLKLIASIITSCGVIGGTLLWIGKKILDKTLKPFKEQMDEMDKTREEQHKETKTEIGNIREELRVNTLNTLKNTMVNENMPFSERLDAGRKYIEMGGNGGGKIYFHELEKQATERLTKGERL